MTHAQFGLTSPSAVVGQTLFDEPLFRQIASHEEREFLAIARHKALSASRHCKELGVSTIEDPAVREATIGITEPTVGTAAAAIAHEVRQPLAAMVMSANAGLRWLKRSQPDLDEVRAAFERIARDGHRANEMIANVRAIFGKDRCEKTRASVNTLIGEVLGLVQEELESHRISVQCELIDGLPEVMAERMQLQQVLLNLLMNAIDAMSTVSCERRLMVTSRLDARGVTIAVADSGSGIAPSYVDRIFDPFFTTKPDGMGIGLSICRSIIESHGGRLWFSPLSPRGTTFYVHLPAEPKKPD